LKTLGSGSSGSVFLAHDCERETGIALKVLRRVPHGNALLRFKEEFRSLREIGHPNLVRLHELLEHDGQWFYTMEYVHGRDFLSYVRPSLVDCVHEPTLTLRSSDGGTGGIAGAVAADADYAAQAAPLDVARLRTAIGQLAAGLNELHRHDKIHRDVKPSNILVTDDDRLVLLDFGLIARPGAVERAGTEGYMSPEQDAGAPVGPPSDWYGVGVVLYQALTSRLPARSVDPRESIDPMAQSDLCELCSALLARDPSARPSGSQVLALWGEVPSVGSALRATLPFVGRRVELDRLSAAFSATSDGHPATVIVEGESGVGKTRLVSRFRELLASGALILSGRCYEHEAVPYKAFDEIMDGLSDRLLGLATEDRQRIIGEAAPLLTRAFPVLRRVTGHGLGALEHTEPQELRNRMFAALRALLARLAERSPLAVLIDDLHWADADSLALLRAITQPPNAPRMLVVATTRATAPVALAWRQHVGGWAQVVELKPLPIDEASEMVKTVATASSRRLNARAIAIEADGHPLFIQELVRHAIEVAADEPQPKLEEALRRRIRQRDDLDRQLLSLLAIAGRPLPQRLAARFVNAEPSRMFAALDGLRADSLVKTSTETIEAYHDRVREAAMAEIVGERALLHRKLAVLIEQTGDADPETLAIHWRAAGDTARAGRFMAAAAERAARVFAFEQAARLYAAAIELAPTEASMFRLQLGLADALANAGRGYEAARSYLAASEAAPDSRERVLLQRRAADQLLRSGRIDQALDLFSGVLSDLGIALPRSTFAAVVQLVWLRLKTRLRGLSYEERDESAVPADDLARIDVCYALGTGLATFEHLRGPLFYCRSSYLALKAGEPSRVSRALALEAIQTTVTNLAPEAYGVMDRGLEIARRLDDPAVLGFALLSRGIVDFAHGRWRTAVEYSAQADRVLAERSTGCHWDRTMAQLLRCYSLFKLGRLPEAADRVLAVVREADQRNDLFAAMNARIHYHNLAWVREGRIDEALAGIRAAQQSRSMPDGFMGFDLWILLAQVDLDLFTGHPEQAWQRVDAVWRHARKSLLFKVIPLKVEALYLYGRAAFGNIAASPMERHRLVDQAVKGLRRVRAPWAHILAGLLRASAAKLTGRLDDAVAELQAAAALAEKTEMGLHAAVARWCLGSLIGGSEGRWQRLVAESVLHQQSFRRPEGLIPMLAPAFTSEGMLQ